MDNESQEDIVFRDTSKEIDEKSKYHNFFSLIYDFIESQNRVEIIGLYFNEIFACLKGLFASLSGDEKMFNALKTLLLLKLDELTEKTEEYTYEKMLKRIKELKKERGLE